MNEPTDKQIKEFWEWCGFKFTPHLSSRGNSYKTTEIMEYPSGFSHIVHKGESVEPDLNNLFKYAEPLFVSMACGSLNEDDWKGAWAKVITHDRKGIGAIREEGITPALALFWAIYEAIKGTK